MSEMKYNSGQEDKVMRWGREERRNRWTLGTTFICLPEHSSFVLFLSTLRMSFGPQCLLGKYGPAHLLARIQAHRLPCALGESSVPPYHSLLSTLDEAEKACKAVRAEALHSLSLANDWSMNSGFGVRGKQRQRPLRVGFGKNRCEASFKRKRKGRRKEGRKEEGRREE